MAPRYLPRSWWADSDWRRGGAQLVDDDLHRLGNVCHYPGRSSDFGRMSLESLRRNLRGWWNYHVNTRGWSDIGYQTAVAMTADGPVVVDLRGIGRVPAAHASASNPRANWHGGATLWVVGNTETPDPQLVDAYRHYRTTVWLDRWPSATGVTGHRRVPGTSTGCPGDPILALVDDGALTAPRPQEDTVSKQDVIEALNEGQEYASPHLAELYGEDRTTSLRWQQEWTLHYARGARDAARRGRDLEQANGAKLDALMDAQSGVDLSGIREHIDQHFAAASQERADILALVEQVGSGERDAAAVVDEIATRLSGDAD